MQLKVASLCIRRGMIWEIAPLLLQALVVCRPLPWRKVAPTLRNWFSGFGGAKQESPLVGAVL